MPHISVVIPSYNGAHRLPRLLESLAGQIGADWEGLVVLDGSTDDSEAVVDEWARRAPVRAVRLPENRGRPAALNAGFAAATGTVLVRCDDDLEVPPDFLANHARHHEGDRVGVVGMCADVFAPSPYARAYGRRADEHIRRTAYSTPEGLLWRYWSANCSVTRDTFDLVGGYDEAFREYGWEDIDWGYRLHRAGFPIECPADVEARHYNPAISALDRSEKAFQSGASRRRFEATHPDSGLPDLRTSLSWSPWNIAVRSVALWMTHRSVRGFASTADGLSARLPEPVARKLISLSVEAAGFAGRRDLGREA